MDEVGGWQNRKRERREKEERKMRERRHGGPLRERGGRACLGATLEAEMAWEPVRDDKYDECVSRRPEDIASPARPCRRSRLWTCPKPGPGRGPDHFIALPFYMKKEPGKSFALAYYTQPVYSQKIAIKSGDSRDLMLQTG